MNVFHSSFLPLSFLSLFSWNRNERTFCYARIAFLSSFSSPPSFVQLMNGVASLAHISRSSDHTTKLLLKLADGLQVETVIIPWKGKRSTLCISSQVGCRQGKETDAINLALRSLSRKASNKPCVSSLLQVASFVRLVEWESFGI